MGDIRQRLLATNYHLRAVIPDSQLAEGLAELAVDAKKGYFSSIALFHTKVESAEDGPASTGAFHHIYVRYSERCPKEEMTTKTKSDFVRVEFAQTDEGIQVNLDKVY
jgi:hypothetical protein